ncbi:MAG: hypothetical protein PVG86_07125 [Desulfobacterales bacterium]|jgi:hypothetical protein
MPITTKVDRTRNLTIFTLTGELSIDEILGTLKSFWEARELTLNTLWDARNAIVTNLRSSELENITGLLGQYRNRFEERKNGKAAIAASTDLQYGLSRILGTLYEREDVPIKLHPFRTMEEAIQWLGYRVDSPSPEHPAACHS